MPLEAGDIVIFPHGDSHIMENGPRTKTVDNGEELVRILSQGLKIARMGGGGEITKFVCGYMACEPRLANVFLGGLPSMFKVNIGNDAAGCWLENSIRFSVAEADASSAGSEAVLADFQGIIRRDAAALHCIVARPADQLAGRSARRGSRKGSGDDASAPRPPLDNC